ncbi:MAG: AAA family ATPase, partial [Coriobacteriia bacterium]|nr:AAA family ATPase [Coriobacteriia bacterium]
MSDVGLSVTRVTIDGFRSYKTAIIEPDPHLTVFVGPNAVGKTNLIEALQILTATESFRKPQWSEVVNWEKQDACLCLIAEGDGRSLEIALTITRAGKRVYQINGKPKKRLAEVIGVFPSVTFTPDDLRLIKDSADKRRGALDSLGAQLSPAYLDAKNEFERVLKQRNAALRAEVIDQEELSVWSERLVSSGARLFSARARLFERL